MRTVFYRLSSGREPVRDWLEAIGKEDRARIALGVKRLEFGWPIGMPLARKLRPGLWELRRRVASGQARVLFGIRDDAIILLHAFMKKTARTPPDDIRTALGRLASMRT